MLNIITMLQWSHVFSDMVSGSLSLSAATCSSLQWSHVFSDMVRTGGDTTADPNAAASMEPCLFRHGKGTVALGKMTQAQLQWSHVFSDMVRDKESIDKGNEIEASMEPCLFRHGKAVYRDLRECRTFSFNGAMSFQTW